MTGLSVSAFGATKISTKIKKCGFGGMLRAAIILLCGMSPASVLRAQTHESTKPNPAIPEAKVRSRANALLKQMTLDEKIAQLVQLPGFPIAEFAANADGQTVE